MLCDLARLTLIVGTFKQDKRISKYSVNISLVIISLIFVSLGVVWEYYVNISKQDPNNKSL